MDVCEPLDAEPKRESPYNATDETDDHGPERPVLRAGPRRFTRNSISWYHDAVGLISETTVERRCTQTVQRREYEIMKEQASVDRRGFLTMIGMAAGTVALSRRVSAASDTKSPSDKLKLGVTSYSLRNFSLDEALVMTQTLGLSYISLKSMHLPLDSTKAERVAAAKKVKEAGIELMGGGVISLKNDEAMCRNAFEYVRDAGMPVMVASPDPNALPLLDTLVKEFDIKVAIHNHGPGDTKYPTPVDAYDMVQPFDKRIGCCIDVGHTVRVGANEIECIHAVKDRLHDFHIKDVTQRNADGKNIEVGRGVIDIPGVLKALIDVEFHGHVALEYEKNAENPLPGMRESVGYLKGAMAALQMS